YKTKEAVQVPEIKCISTINFFMLFTAFFAGLRSLGLVLVFANSIMISIEKSKHITMFAQTVDKSYILWDLFTVWHYLHLKVMLFLTIQLIEWVSL
ncbi:MAG: hypothetical protein K0S80_4855, partial [Neobacillus sp.]|nr:hypothetical protein [Neobacillus sp.]